MQQARFCRHHSSREKPEDCGDGFLDARLVDPANLTTTTGINRALSQVFLLMAQGRISQKQAVAFGYLSQLLLQTVPGIRSEYVSAHGYQAWQNNLKCKLDAAPESFRANNASEESLCAPSPTPESPARENRTRPDVVILSESASRDKRRISPNPSLPAKVYQQDELSPVNKVRESGGTSPPAPPSPDYADIYRRSLDLLDRKFDTTPEGRGEAKALMAELKVIDRARAKPYARPTESRTPSTSRALEVAAPREPGSCSSGRGAVQPALRPLGPPCNSRPPQKALAAKSAPRATSAATATSALPGTHAPAEPPKTPAAPIPGFTLWREGHSHDWYAPASWSKPRPDPHASRQEQLRRKLRGNMSDRRWQHQNQCCAFWR